MPDGSSSEAGVGRGRDTPTRPTPAAEPARPNVETGQKSPTTSLPARVASPFQVAGAMVSRTNRTEPSARRRLTPQMWLLRAAVSALLWLALPQSHLPVTLGG